MHTLSLAILSTLLALVGCSQIGTPSIHDQSMTAVRLDVTDGTCSGTVVAPTIILTAAHCFEEDTSPKEDTSIKVKSSPKKKKEADHKKDETADPNTSMKINGRETKIISIVSDGNDHVLVEVDHVFENYAVIGARPIAGDHIHFWGNPARLNMVYREGYVSHFIHGMMMMNVNGFFGDSGGGIFDDSGHIVGVINIINVHPYMGVMFSLMGSDPLEFTDQQYQMMGVAH